MLLNRVKSDFSAESRAATREACPYPDVVTSSDNYARRFAGASGAYFLDVQARIFESLTRGLSSSEVLEVGGGHGQLVEAFLHRNCRLTMLGSTESTHARVRARFPDAPIEYATGDLLPLNYSDKSFDLVVAVRLLAHIDDWETLLSEFCRIARRSVIIDYPSSRSANALTPLMFRLKKNIEKNARPYATFLPSRIAREFGNNGFNVVQSQGQFLLPMVVHRAMSGARWLRVSEDALRTLNLTSVFGSPVLVRADRA